jgi:hypothetical protein
MLLRAFEVEVPISSVATPVAKSNHRAAALQADAWIAPRAFGSVASSGETAAG